jgi:hypothetical protein
MAEREHRNVPEFVNPRRSIATRALRDPIVPVASVVRETPAVSFADLVRMMAEGIADAQAELDRTSAEMVTELSATRVKIVPQITETVSADGSVTFEQAEPVSLSLLEIGISPTFYQFSQATIEVAMDIQVVEVIEEEGRGRRRFGLFAGTASVQAERKLNRDVSTSSKLTATLVPVPSPLRTEPTRKTIVEGDIV